MFARELRTAARRPTGRTGRAPRNFRRVAAAAGVLRTPAARPPRAGHRVLREIRPYPPVTLLRPPLPRRVDERLDVALRRRLEHAVTQIQDVHARPAGALDACFDRLFHFIHRTQE